MDKSTQLHIPLRMDWRDILQSAVERAIATMWDRFDEPLLLEDLADAAILSKFYFSRVFRDLTGTSPGRFLTAIRICQAKGLLLETSLTVTDISYRVGYNSLGTFTSRFTRSVSISPARFRALSHAGIPVLPRLSAPASGPDLGTVEGSVSVPETDLPTRIYVGAFKDPIVQGIPRSCDILDSPGRYRLDAVPDGLWFIKVAVVPVCDPGPFRRGRQPLFIGTSQVVTVRAGRVIEVDIATRAGCVFDLPILLALPELDSQRLPALELVAPRSS